MSNADDLIKLINAKSQAARQDAKDTADRAQMQRLTAADQKMMELLDATMEGCAVVACDVLNCTQVSGEMIQWAMDLHRLAEQHDNAGLERRFAAIAVKFLNKVATIQEQRAAEARAEGAQNGV